jgi:hypothetical protein
VDFVYDGSSCVPISDDLCIMRGTDSGLYNEVTNTGWSWDDEGPENSLWGNGGCSDVTPAQQWRDAVWADGTGPRTSVGELYCVEDTTTAVIYEITMRSWDASRSGGLFDYTRDTG